jgi:hypothetical protein
MHTGVLFWGTFETFISYKKNPSRKFAFVALLFFTLAYVLQVHLYKQMHGTFPYGFMRQLDDIQRFLLYVAFFCYGSAFYIIGEYINKMFWTNKMKEIKT